MSRRDIFEDSPGSQADHSGRSPYHLHSLQWKPGENYNPHDAILQIFKLLKWRNFGLPSKKINKIIWGLIKDKRAGSKNRNYKSNQWPCIVLTIPSWLPLGLLLNLEPLSWFTMLILNLSFQLPWVLVFVHNPIIRRISFKTRWLINCVFDLILFVSWIITPTSVLLSHVGFYVFYLCFLRIS